MVLANRGCRRRRNLTICRRLVRRVLRHPESVPQVLDLLLGSLRGRHGGHGAAQAGRRRRLFGGDVRLERRGGARDRLERSDASSASAEAARAINAELSCWESSNS